MASKETNKEKTYFSIKGMSVANVRRLSDKIVAFSLLGNGLGLYNLRIVAGKKGDFIASPQERGKDGKYYAVYALYLSEEDEKKVIAAVLKKLPKEDDIKPDEF